MSSTKYGVRWHSERRKQLLERHPEARSLMGPNPWTALVVLALVVLQVSLSVAFSALPWWAILLLAYAVGAFIAHALGVLIHDAAHDLVFRKPALNKSIAIFANVPLVIPAAIDFREKHLLHHAHLGEPDGADTQAPGEWDFRFVTSRLRTYAWHVIGPMVVTFQSRGHKMSKWAWANIAANSIGMALVFIFLGWKAFMFLGASGLMAFAHHPVGVRRYGEHLVLTPEQPTASYYGPLNWISFDVGYHVEHHDLPNVPWNRARKLHTMAKELYAPLAHISSWTGLLWELTFHKGEGPPRYFLESRPTAVEQHEGGHHVS
jgi:sphingolipid delta-4 desaturase